MKTVKARPMRLGCTHCDVQWTGPEGSACWICDRPGDQHSSMFWLQREEPHDPHV